jgi:hypothetical protein
MRNLFAWITAMTVPRGMEGRLVTCGPKWKEESGNIYLQ